MKVVVWCAVSVTRNSDPSCFQSQSIMNEHLTDSCVVFKNIGDEVAEYRFFQQDSALSGTFHIRTLYGTINPYPANVENMVSS